MSVQIFASLEIEGKKFPLTTDRNYLLGRKLDGVHKLDIILESETVDAKHALIKTYGDELKILDLHSKSGTFINKQRLEDLKEMLLKDSDTLQIGNLMGSIRYNDIEFENSSGFHEGPNNKSDLVCNSPNQIVLRSSPSIQLQNAKRTSTPNCQNEQPNSMEAHSSVVTTVLTRKSYDFDQGRQHNLNIAGTEAINDSFGNKTDSFNIPETQQCIERSSSSLMHVGETSMECNDTKVSKDNVTNIDHGRDNGEDDSYIPETQDIAPEYINSQLRNHGHNEHVNLFVAPNIPIEENANGVDLVEGSQFRICTQEYNETNCLGDEDSNNSDLLATVPSSFIIPHIKHDPVILNASGCAVLTITSNKECLSEENNPKSTNCNEGKESECENDKELLAIQWEEKDLDCLELLERDDMCTPDLFFTPELGDPNSLQKKENDKEVSLETSSSFQMAKSDTEQHNHSMCEDSNDLMPTQVFTRAEAENSKGGKINSGPEGEYLTLSDKENMTPAAVAALKIVDEFMDQTQIFSSDNIKSTVKEKNPIQDATFVPPATTFEEDEDDLLPTQVFLCPPKAQDATVNNESLNTKCSHIPSENSLDALDKERKDNSTNAKAVNDRQISEIPDHEFLKPNTNALHSLKKASSTPLNATITESPDIDMLLCTPQLISDNFKQCETKVKENFLAKHKALFSDDSDDESDTSQMLTEAKPSRDFDKLLPHLNTNQISPKHNQTEGELRKFKHTFAETVTKKTRSSKEKGAIQKVASRDERHETRDRKRDKKVEIVPKKDHKPEIKTTQKEGEQKNTKQNEIIITPRKVVVRLQRKRGTKDMETNAYCDNNSRRSSLKSEKKSKIPKKEIEMEEVKVGKGLKEPGRDIFGSPEQQDDKSSVRKSERKQSKSTSIDVTKTSPKSSGSRRITRLTSRLVSETTQYSEGRPKDGKNENAANNSKQKNKTKSKMNVRHDTKSKIPDNQTIKDRSQNKATTSEDLETERETRNPVITERRLLRSSETFNNSETFEASSTRSSTSSTSVHSSDHTNKLKVSTTMVDSERFEHLIKYSSGIWCITGDPTKCDILIMDKGNRTYKFLVALARGIPIVTSSWLESVNKKREIVNMSGHFYTDETFEKRYKFSLIRSVDLARKRKLLAGYKFFMTSEIRPQPDEIKTIIECAGGKVLTDISSSSTNNQKLYLISTKNDQKLWHKYRRASGDIRIISTEGIMSAVMRQSLKPLDSNLLA